MKKLEISKGSHSPQVTLDADKNIFEITGNSFPEDSKDFYQPVIDWLNEYGKSNPGKLHFKFNLFYLSSSSIISVKQILLALKELAAKGAEVKITWCHDDDDDDIIKMGEDYKKLTGLPFEMAVNT